MTRLICSAALAAILAMPVHAQGYFDGKTVTYIIATNPGGNYDAYGRLIGRYLEDKLGADRVVFRNLPGAGHIIGANTLYNSEPDGLTIGTFNTGLIYAQILGAEGIDFDLREFGWIGKAAADARVIILSEGSGLKSFKDLRDSPETVRFAGSGIGSASYTETKMLTDALDLDIEMIPGYNGNEGEMAMLRGEVSGQIGSYGSLLPFVEAGNGVVALGIGGDVQPQALDQVSDDKGRAIVSLIDAMSNLGRFTAAPPGVEPAVLEELRAAYMAVMEDPEFLTEADKLGLPIDPLPGDVVAEMVESGLSQTPETVAIISAALDVEVPSLSVTGTELMELSNGNKGIHFMNGNEEVYAEISGSRTALSLDGAQADREALSVGMVCDITYNPGHEANEPSTMSCSSP